MFTEEDWARDDAARQARRRRWKIVGGCVVALFAFSCVASVGVVVAAIIYLQESIETAPISELPASATALPTRVPGVAGRVAATVTPMPTRVPDPDLDPTPVAVDAVVPWAIGAPARDYYAVAKRMGVDVGPRTVTATRYSADDVGIGRTFSVDGRTIKATLYAITDQAYFWVDTRLDPDVEVVEAAAEAFETRYYPQFSAIFGREWSPGVDGDPRFSVVHLASSGGLELGFFQSGNQYPRTVEPDSNEQEVIFMNMEELTFGEPLYFGTLVHEVQHLVHWGHDSNETVWLDEGLGQLAELMVGLDTAQYADYMRRTETPLTGWSYADDDTVFAHYAASYLFMVYLWEQLGDEAIAALVRDPANGTASVAAVLDRDPHGRSLDAFMLDWAIAALLDDPEVDARYGYRALDPRLPTLANRVKRVPATVSGALAPFGVHYIELGASGPVSVTFSAATTTDLFPPPPTGSGAAWYAPPADSADATLGTELDLTLLDEATLGFWAWYDLEPDYDFAYVLVSADAGVTWNALTPTDAVDGEFGPALGAASVGVDSAEGGWVWHEVDLSAYSGQPVQLRVNLLTDLAVTAGGLAVDGAVVESGAGESVAVAWSPDGFERLSGVAPVVWQVAVVDQASGSVRVIDVAEEGVFSAEGGRETLVIIPVGGLSSRPLPYTLSAER